MIIDEQQRVNSIDAAYYYIMKKSEDNIGWQIAVVVGAMFAGGVLGYFLHFLQTVAN